MKKRKIENEWVEEIAEAFVEKYGIRRKALFGEKGAFLELQKRVIEKALNGEMTYHLGGEYGLACQKI